MQSACWSRPARTIRSLIHTCCALSWIIEPKFVSTYNLENIIHWTSLYAILGIGAALVIITGGTDLSIGSVVGMTGCVLALILDKKHVPAFAAACAVLAAESGGG